VKFSPHNSGRLAAARRGACAAALALAVVLLPLQGPADAAGTDPTLALSGAEAISSEGVTAVRLHGSFQFEDQIQFSFPAGVFIYQGSQFAHIASTGAAAGGSSALLADGLAPAELTVLLGSGTPAAAPAGLTRLEPSRLEVALPPGFIPGQATAVVYAILEGTAFLSNAVTFTIP